ncbi:unnamed protein product [Lampetra planeri]
MVRGDAAGGSRRWESSDETSVGAKPWEFGISKSHETTIHLADTAWQGAPPAVDVPTEELGKSEVLQTRGVKWSYP